MNRSVETGVLFPEENVDDVRLLSEQEFDEAVARLQAGQPCFTSAGMLRRFGDTIVEKLWEGHEQPAEPD